MSQPLLSSMCRSCQRRSLGMSSSSRRFSSLVPRRVDQQPTASGDSSAESIQRKPQLQNPLSRGSNQSAASKPSSKSFSPFSNSALDDIATDARAAASTRPGSVVSRDEPYHLNVYAHKHNTHVTFTEPSRDIIMSYSAGNIGLRKAQRGSFDASYQLSTYTMRKMMEKQWRTGGKQATNSKMLTIHDPEVRERGVEVVMRGYGPGREAFQKALLGTEGRIIRPLVKKVTDNTRLKFGGTRSRATRRLG